MTVAFNAIDDTLLHRHPFFRVLAGCRLGAQQFVPDLVGGWIAFLGTSNCEARQFKEFAQLSVSQVSWAISHCLPVVAFRSRIDFQQELEAVNLLMSRNNLLLFVAERMRC